MIAIIQVRHSSKRLPGKALLQLGNSSVLGHCVKRISKSRLISDILIATSSEDSDHPIFQFCTTENYPVFRGSLIDVGERLVAAAKSANVQKFIRICGDSPFIDPHIIDRAISLSKISDFDLVTNVFPRSFPKGQSVEVIKTESLEKTLKEKRSHSQKEHATKYFYDNILNFRICSFTSGKDMAHSNLSIDTSEDFLTAKTLISAHQLEKLGWQEINKLWQDKVVGK